MPTHKTLIKSGLVDVMGQLVHTDVLITDGQIAAMGHHLVDEQLADEVIDASNLLVTPGLVDVHVHYREPGQTYKETIHTGSLAAAHGGFTTVGAMANVDPTPDTAAKMKAMEDRNAKEGVIHIKQYSPVTVDRAGKQVVDFTAQRQAGAFAFSDDGNGIQTAGVMYRALQQAAETDSIVAAHVEDNSLTFGGVINAGKKAKQLGVPGKISASETSQLARDLILCQATGGHYHMCHVSTKESLELIRIAKEMGLNVTCEVAPHHLLLNDDEIVGCDSNYKMNPPLRHEEDRQALIGGLLDGTIDMIATDHAPHADSEKPHDDLLHAANGITGSETCFNKLYTEFVKPGIFSLEQLLHWLTDAPADVFKLKGAGRLAPGLPADIAIFDLKSSHVLSDDEYLSKGKNTPFTGDTVYGTTVLTMVDGRVVYQREDRK
ncbi:dihydroorotase [uncultured Limosilactobacillus sp.]|uniref:dihydroorotase n=1 Tax=uncultured Limosilactobacillus sp. TaxID=2837629 RepID=UPI0025D9CF28|nr:dihydroorotase [uncultured Limosilactobacillus sp.]